MAKDIYEDVQRHRQDNEENNRKCEVGIADKGKGIYKFVQKRWQEIKVGDLVKVSQDQYFPCDLVLINSSLTKGICYVETKNLDGESNLKHKQAPEDCIFVNTDQDILKAYYKATIECEKENEYLYKFNGQMKLNKETIGLDKDQILLRGSSLKNTKYVYGIAVYTGHDTKIMMNSANSRPKQSKIEKATGKYLQMAVLIQTVVCLTSALYSALWDRLVTTDTYDPIYLELQKSYYIPLTKDEDGNLMRKDGYSSLFYTIPVNLGKWYLALMNFVAISLLVSLEMVKFAQGLVIEWDWMMYCDEQDRPAKVQSSNLNEELGMVNYIFSDKTGTLTKNIMEFKKFTVGTECYGENEQIEFEGKYEQGVTNVNFTDKEFWK